MPPATIQFIFKISAQGFEQVLIKESLQTGSHYFVIDKGCAWYFLTYGDKFGVVSGGGLV